MRCFLSGNERGQCRVMPWCAWRADARRAVG